MGLGSFRYRILFGVVLVFLLWQSSKIWLQFSPTKADSNQVNHFDDAPRDSNQKVPAVQTVLVTVFYEALCPDSRSFFMKQLLPTFKEIPENVKVQPIPYGKATTTKTNTGYSFECQHGPTECEANMIHACSIDFLKDPRQQLEYLTCMIQMNTKPKEIMETCARNLDVNYQPILDCLNEKGPVLLAEYGELTEKNRKYMGFIPTISLNENFSNQAEILKNLLKQVCNLLKDKPKGCTE